MAAAMSGLAATGKERATAICIAGRNGVRDATAGNYVAAAGNLATTADGMMTDDMTTGAIIATAMITVEMTIIVVKLYNNRQRPALTPEFT